MPAAWRRIVEPAIGAHLVNHAIKNNFSVYYWRERNDEVDPLCCNLVKRSLPWKLKAHFQGQKKNAGISKKTQPWKTYLVDNHVLSWKEFLKINPVELF